MIDITTWLNSTTQELLTVQALGPGTVIKESRLTMLEAMNAIQMMDAKMDTGLSRNDRITFDPETNLSSEHICWIVDEMLALEMAWYSGATLCRTVYTSLHYHNIQHLSCSSPLVSNVLRSYAAAWGKTVDLAYSELAKGHVMDGEDCWLDHYGLAVRSLDEVDDISHNVEQAIEWLETYDDPLAVDLARRLDIRLGLLYRFDDDPSRLDMMANLIREMKPVSSSCPIGFDPPISSHLRQNMPIPPNVRLTHTEAWRALRDLVTDLQIIDQLEDLSSWQIILRAYAYAIRSPLLRSLCKTAFDRLAYNPDDLLNYPLSTLGFDQQTVLWRDIVRGYARSTLCTPLQNRPRQRRSFQSLSFAWRERAAIAEHLHPQLVPALSAIRLDCLLEGALAAWDAELVTCHEERKAWSWVETVAAARAELGGHEWQTAWAKLWLATARFISTLLAKCNLPEQLPSDERFRLRQKWPLKLPAGSTTGLSPDPSTRWKSGTAASALQALRPLLDFDSLPETIVVSALTCST